MKKRSRSENMVWARTNSSTDGIESIPLIGAILAMDPNSLMAELATVDEETFGKVSAQLKQLNCLIDELDEEENEDVSHRQVYPLTMSHQEEKKDESTLEDAFSSSRACISAISDYNNSASEAIPTEVLRLVLVADYLKVEELGRLLLLTSRWFMHNLGHDYVWKYICRFRFSDTSKIPASIIDARGYEWLFRQLRTPGLLFHEEVIREPPPPCLSSDNLALLINIRAGKTELACKVVSGKALTQFEDIILDAPIFVAKGSPVEDPATFFEYDLTMLGRHRQNWVITVHGLRLDTNQCCCIHESSPSVNDAWYSRYPSLPSRKEDQIGELTFFQNVYLDPVKRPKCYLGLKVCVVLRCFQRIVTHQDPCSGTITRSAVLEFREMKLAARPIYDDNYRVVQRLDMGESAETFLHLLDKLAGWEG
jgi:hypothetical protein